MTSVVNLVVVVMVMEALHLEDFLDGGPEVELEGGVVGHGGVMEQTVSKARQRTSNVLDDEDSIRGEFPQKVSSNFTAGYVLVYGFSV
jgi:hypothetical protein